MSRPHHRCGGYHANAVPCGCQDFEAADAPPPAVQPPPDPPAPPPRPHGATRCVCGHMYCEHGQGHSAIPAHPAATQPYTQLPPFLQPSLEALLQRPTPQPSYDLRGNILANSAPIPGDLRAVENAINAVAPFLTPEQEANQTRQASAQHHYAPSTAAIFQKKNPPKSRATRKAGGSNSNQPPPPDDRYVNFEVLVSPNDASEIELNRLRDASAAAWITSLRALDLAIPLRMRNNAGLLALDQTLASDPKWQAMVFAPIPPTDQTTRFSSYPGVLWLSLTSTSNSKVKMFPFNIDGQGVITVGQLRANAIRMMKRKDVVSDDEYVPLHIAPRHGRLRRLINGRSVDVGFTFAEALKSDTVPADLQAIIARDREAIERERARGGADDAPSDDAWSAMDVDPPVSAGPRVTVHSPSGSSDSEDSEDLPDDINVLLARPGPSAPATRAASTAPSPSFVSAPTSGSSGARATSAAPRPIAASTSASATASRSTTRTPTSGISAPTSSRSTSGASARRPAAVAVGTSRSASATAPPAVATPSSVVVPRISPPRPTAVHDRPTVSSVSELIRYLRQRVPSSLSRHLPHVVIAREMAEADGEAAVEVAAERFESRLRIAYVRHEDLSDFTGAGSWTDWASAALLTHHPAADSTIMPQSVAFATIGRSIGIGVAREIFQCMLKRLIRRGVLVPVGHNDYFSLRLRSPMAAVVSDVSPSVADDCALLGRLLALHLLLFTHLPGAVSPLLIDAVLRKVIDPSQALLESFEPRVAMWTEKWRAIGREAKLLPRWQAIARHHPMHMMAQVLYDRLDTEHIQDLITNERTERQHSQIAALIARRLALGLPGATLSTDLPPELKIVADAFEFYVGGGETFTKLIHNPRSMFAGGCDGFLRTACQRERITSADVVVAHIEWEAPSSPAHADFRNRFEAFLLGKGFPPGFGAGSLPPGVSADDVDGDVFRARRFVLHAIGRDYFPSPDADGSRIKIGLTEYAGLINYHSCPGNVDYPLITRDQDGSKVLAYDDWGGFDAFFFGELLRPLHNHGAV